MIFFTLFAKEGEKVAPTNTKPLTKQYTIVPLLRERDKRERFVMDRGA